MCLIGWTSDKHWPKLCNLCLSGLTGLSEARLYFIENLISLKSLLYCLLCAVVIQISALVGFPTHFALLKLSRPLIFAICTKLPVSPDLCEALNYITITAFHVVSALQAQDTPTCDSHKSWQISQTSLNRFNRSLHKLCRIKKKGRILCKEQWFYCLVIDFLSLQYLVTNLHQYASWFFTFIGVV